MSLLASDIIRVYSAWRQRKYLCRGSHCVGYHMGCALVGAFGLGPLAWVVIWLHSVGRQRKYLRPGSPCVGYHMAGLYYVWRQCTCLWPGSPCLGCHMATPCMESARVPLAWFSLRRLSYGSTLCGINVNTFGLALFASAIIRLCSVWRQRKYLWRGFPRGGCHMAVLCMASA